MKEHKIKTIKIEFIFYDQSCNKYENNAANKNLTPVQPL